MNGCIYIVVCDLNLKITGIALFGCSLIFHIFFVIRIEDSILLNLNPSGHINGHIVETKMEISIIQSNIADEQLIAIFTQILLSVVHKQSFCLNDCFTFRDGFFCLSIYFFAFTPLLKMLL